MHELKNLVQILLRYDGSICPSTFVVDACPLYGFSFFLAAGGHGQTSPCPTGEREDELDTFKQADTRHVKGHFSVLDTNSRFVEHGKLGAGRQFIAFQALVTQFALLL